MKAPVKKSTEAPVMQIEPAFRFLQMLSIALTVWLAGRMFLPYNEGMLLLIFPLTAAAFYLQVGICRLYPQKKQRDKIPFSHTLPAVVLWGFLSVLAYAPLYGWLQGGLLPELHYDSDFFTWAVITVVFLFLMFLTATLVAMIPPSTFFSYGSVYSLGAVYLIIWILTLFSEQSMDGRLMFSAGLITVFFFVVMNQTGIDDLSKKSGVMGVTSELRGKNLKLTGLLLAALLGLFLIFVIILTGIYFTAKSLLFIILRAVLNQDSVAAQDIEVQSANLFANGLFASPSVNKILYVIFAVAMVLLFVFACFKMITHSQIRLRDIPSKLLAFWKKLLEKLWELFAWSKPQHFLPKRTVSQPYQDRISQINPSVYRMTAYSLDSFNRHLREITGANERFCYAYGVLITQLRRQDSKQALVLMTGMTPREIEKKLVSEGHSGFSEITRLYETIRYAEKPVSEADAERLIRRMCVYIEDNFSKMK